MSYGFDHEFGSGSISITS